MYDYDVECPECGSGTIHIVTKVTKKGPGGSKGRKMTGEAVCKECLHIFQLEEK